MAIELDDIPAPLVAGNTKRPEIRGRFGVRSVPSDVSIMHGLDRGADLDRARLRCLGNFVNHLDVQQAIVEAGAMWSARLKRLSKVRRAMPRCK